MRHSKFITLTIVLICTSGMLISSNQEAYARLNAHSTGGPTSTATVAFIAYPTTSPSGSNPNGVALVLANTKSPQDFYVKNGGTISISSVTMTISMSSGSGKYTLFRCDIDVDFSAGACVSGSTKITVDASNPVTLPTPVGGWYAFEITPQNKTTPTISVSVSSSQIRAPIITNS